MFSGQSAYILGPLQAGTPVLRATATPEVDYAGPQHSAMSCARLLAGFITHLAKIRGSAQPSGASSHPIQIMRKIRSTTLVLALLYLGMIDLTNECDLYRLRVSAQPLCMCWNHPS